MTTFERKLLYTTATLFGVVTCAMTTALGVFIYQGIKILM